MGGASFPCDVRTSRRRATHTAIILHSEHFRTPPSGVTSTMCSSPQDGHSHSRCKRGGLQRLWWSGVWLGRRLWLPPACDTDILLWRDYGQVKATSDPWLRWEASCPFPPCRALLGWDGILFFFFFTRSTHFGCTAVLRISLMNRELSSMPDYRDCGDAVGMCRGVGPFSPGVEACAEFALRPGAEFCVVSTWKNARFASVSMVT